jgi:hypothetical protein
MWAHFLVVLGLYWWWQHWRQQRAAAAAAAAPPLPTVVDTMAYQQAATLAHAERVRALMPLQMVAIQRVLPPPMNLVDARTRADGLRTLPRNGPVTPRLQHLLLDAHLVVSGAEVAGPDDVPVADIPYTHVHLVADGLRPLAPVTLATPPPSHELPNTLVVILNVQHRVTLIKLGRSSL